MTSATATKSKLGRSARRDAEEGRSAPAQGSMSEVKTAVRTLKIFELFAARKRQLVLAELAEQLEIPPSSCLLLTLHENPNPYLVAQPTGTINTHSAV